MLITVNPRLKVEMSSRKVASRSTPGTRGGGTPGTRGGGTPGTRSAVTPGTGSKSKNKPPTPKHQLNTTMMSKSKSPSNLQVNATVCGAGLSVPPRLIAPDWGLQCDMAYSEYLRALISRNIVQEAIQNYEVAVDEQLAQQAELLRRVTYEDIKVVSEIKETKIQLEVQKLYLKLEETFKSVDELLRDYNVEENLTTCIGSCESALNKLHLTNIKPFKAQEDYDKFSALLEKCTNIMKKLKTVIGNTEATQVLGEGLRKYVELQKEFDEKNKMVSDLQASFNLLIFKNASNKFADFEEDDAE